MDNKLKILAIIFLLISAGLILNDYFNALKLENYQFDLPEGFHSVGNNKNGDMKITNGKATLFISKFNADDLNKSINSYKEHCAKNNYVVKESNITLNNIDIYKITETKLGSTHYWFTHDGIGYSIYTWNKVENSDDIVSDLINKMI